MKRTVALALVLAAASTAYGEIYTWKDARGTSFYTNSLHEIPARYLRRAKILDVASGKKLPISAAQAAAKPAPAQAGAAMPTPPATPLATPVPAVSAAASVPPAANGVIPAAATAPAPPAVTMPQPQQVRGYVRRRMRNRGSSGEESE